MPTSLGPAEILVILIVALIVLGPKKLPEAGRQIGKALAEVRRWSSNIQSEVRDAFDGEAEATAPQAETPPPVPPVAPPPAPPPVTHPGAAGDGRSSDPPADLPPEWASPPPQPPSAGPGR